MALTTISYELCVRQQKKYIYIHTYMYTDTHTIYTVQRMHFSTESGMLRVL